MNLNFFMKNDKELKKEAEMVQIRARPVGPRGIQIQMKVQTNSHGWTARQQTPGSEGRREEGGGGRIINKPDRKSIDGYCIRNALGLSYIQPVHNIDLW